MNNFDVIGPDAGTDGMILVRGEFVVQRGDQRRIVKFQIDPEYGYQQWGETPEWLGRTSESAQAIVDALREAEVWAPDLEERAEELEFDESYRKYEMEQAGEE